MMQINQELKMRKLILSFLAIHTAIIVFAGSWRTGESQVKIHIASHEQIVSLNHLKINYEPCAPDMVRAYITPKEKERLAGMGFEIETEIEDLNTYNLDFWQTKDAYHSYQEIVDLADSLETHFPAICKKFYYGLDASGQYTIFAIKISDNVATDETEPEVFFDGGIHGDEIGGPENIIRFARDLCLNYNENPNITYLVDNREIWLYPMVNPYGREANPITRYNSNGVDLNRDCGYMWDADGSTYGAFNEVESKALRTCNLENQFVVYTSYHSGTEFVSYPWSYRPDPTSDHAHIDQLASIYVNTSGYPSLPYGQGYSGMYPINGSTKDAYYGITGSVSWSIEISYDKQPPASEIMLYYNYNKPAMLAMIEYAGYGLSGSVTDAGTGDPVAAMVFVNNYYPAYTDPAVGDYHKYVLPGTYSVTVKANGYETQTVNNITVTANNSTVTDFQLSPAEGQYVYKLLAVQIPGNNFADEGFTPGALGAPDNVNYSIGKSGWCVLDMQYPVFNGPGNDFVIYEGDSSPEGYSCYVSSTMDGPWQNLGTGNGTTQFDISASGLTEARYIKILDDGDGNGNTANAGFDLDAVKALEPVSGIYISVVSVLIDDSNGNNNGQFDPGETIDIIVTLKNNGDITASNVTGTISTISPFITIIDEMAEFGTLGQNQTGEGTFTLTANTGTPPGEMIAIDLNVSANNGTYTNSFVLNFVVGLIVEDWETGDFSKFNWETGGNNDWVISTFDPFEGNYCSQSGDINDDQSTYLSISYNVQTAGEISFYRKVSSESTYDFLRFYIDDIMQGEWSGEVPWSQVQYNVTAGQHTFKWEYSKDYSVTNGSDCGWVDYIILPSGANQNLTALFSGNPTELCEGQTVNFTDYSIGEIVFWNWSFPGGDPLTSTLQNPSVLYLNAGIYDASLTVSDGTGTQTLTLEDYIHVYTFPAIPEKPQGEEYPMSFPGLAYEYNTGSVANAGDYDWIAEPAEAIESMVITDTSCLIDFVDYIYLTCTLKVKALNECGESEYSEELILYVWWEGIEESSLGNLKISPNPNNGRFIISFGQPISDPVDIMILNTIGEVVYTKDHILPGENQLLDIDPGYFMPGVYLVEVRNDKTCRTSKIIVK
jgi:PKD repeat protein